MVNRTVSVRKKNPLVVVAGLVVSLLAIYFGTRQMWSGINELNSGSSLVSRIQTASDAALKQMRRFDGAPAITMDYPAAWDVKPAGPPFLLQASTLKGAINFSLIHQSNNPNQEMTLDSFTACNLDEIRKIDQSGMEFDRVHSSDIEEINDIPVRKTILSMLISSDGKPLKIRQMMATFIVDQESFILTCSAPNEGFDAAKHTFEAILGSIRRK